ncbi:PEP-CTERM sorting domain-containing protein [Rhodopirellula sp. JC740]|uniref:PEP-CTERM sorting domain-containing protein n=1 Tax=Rhodopirellula halodulae TaxID=2894198 RepID=A0ABS8NLK8_9BACT|nr:PEP-CTERM sorting domain-containing protein [Rhodopirellula sp. JC740]MCC9644400.1 PEP-CTERM sorting domain-containing protein [Rhodopirellula sp. JC740]
MIFGNLITDGMSVTGFFFLDDAAPQTDGFAGLTGSAAQYDQNVTQGFQINIGGSTFESTGVYNTAVINDFTSAVGQTPLDAFVVADGVSTGFADITGTEILVNGSPGSGRIGIQFDDADATAFSSDGLPTVLNLSDFESITATIDGEEPFPGGGAPFVYSVDFSVDTISVTAVPEPSMLAALGIAGTSLMARSRSRRRRD